MNLPKIILLCCIIFLIALLLYIIIKKKDEIKAYVLKVDEKISKRNEKFEQDKKQKEEVDKEQVNEEQENKSVNKNVDKHKNEKNNNKSSNNKDENKEAQNSKLKPSKATEQIRPVLLPPNSEAEERDIKLLEMSKQPQMLNNPNQKALDFKYGAKNMQQGSSQKTSSSIPRARTGGNNFISFSKDEDNFNPLKRDVNRQFDDIKNFLELPENLNTMQTKGVSYNGKTFNTVDKIDASIFNSPESHYVDYRKRPQTSSTIINSVNNARNQDTQNVMYTNTKYARSPSTNYGMPTFNLTDREQEEASRFREDFTLTKEQEDIDLNKLPNNLKKMIIQNILDRKNYD